MFLEKVYTEKHCLGEKMKKTMISGGLMYGILLI